MSSLNIFPESWGRIQRKTWCMGPELTITSPYVHSRVDSITFTTGNQMPESTWTLCQSRLYPQSRTSNFASTVGGWEVEPGYPPHHWSVSQLIRKDFIWRRRNRYSSLSVFPSWKLYSKGSADIWGDLGGGPASNSLLFVIYMKSVLNSKYSQWFLPLVSLRCHNNSCECEW